MSRDQIEFALDRKAGRKSEAIRRAESLFETSDDLYTTCQGCGTIRTGSKKDLQQPCESCGYGP